MERTTAVVSGPVQAHNDTFNEALDWMDRPDSYGRRSTDHTPEEVRDIHLDNHRSLLRDADNLAATRRGVEAIKDLVKQQFVNAAKDYEAHPSIENMHRLLSQSEQFEGLISRLGDMQRQENELRIRAERALDQAGFAMERR